MKNLDKLEDFQNQLFRQATDQLIAKGLISKGVEAADRFGMTIDQYKSIRSNRTKINVFQWYTFIAVVRNLDPLYTYRWLKRQVFPK